MVFFMSQFCVSGSANPPQVSTYSRASKARQGKEGEELKDRELEMPEQES